MASNNNVYNNQSKTLLNPSHFKRSDTTNGGGNILWSRDIDWNDISSSLGSLTSLLIIQKLEQVIENLTSLTERVSALENIPEPELILSATSGSITRPKGALSSILTNGGNDSITITVGSSADITVPTGLTLTYGANTNKTANTPTATYNGSTVTPTWSSSNTSVATVSGTTITAKAVGSATLTATYNGKTATYTVNVTNEQTYGTVTEGWTYSSENTNIATISGITVTGVAPGRTHIQVTYNGKTCELAGTVTIEEAIPEPVNPTLIVNDPASTTIADGESTTITVTSSVAGELTLTTASGTGWNASVSANATHKTHTITVNNTTNVSASGSIAKDAIKATFTPTDTTNYNTITNQSVLTKAITLSAKVKQDPVLAIDPPASTTIADGESTTIHITSNTPGSLRFNSNNSTSAGGSNTAWSASITPTSTAAQSFTITITNNTAVSEQSTIATNGIKVNFTPSDTDGYNSISGENAIKQAITLSAPESQGSYWYVGFENQSSVDVNNIKTSPTEIGWHNFTEGTTSLHVGEVSNDTKVNWFVLVPADSGLVNVVDAGEILSGYTISTVTIGTTSYTKITQDTATKKFDYDITTSNTQPEPPVVSGPYWYVGFENQSSVDVNNIKTSPTEIGWHNFTTGTTSLHVGEVSNDTKVNWFVLIPANSGLINVRDAGEILSGYTNSTITVDNVSYTKITQDTATKKFDYDITT